MKAQEAALRQSPDIVIATPGRLIDHLHNAPNFSLHEIEVLVLDEADRMLDETFAEQMKELIRMCARQRQTMLFSATMTDQVRDWGGYPVAVNREMMQGRLQISDLAAMSLKRPVKLFINENTDTALNLRQEFIRIRENREIDREPIVAGSPSHSSAQCRPSVCLYVCMYPPCCSSGDSSILATNDGVRADETRLSSSADRLGSSRCSCRAITRRTDTNATRTRTQCIQES